MPKGKPDVIANLESILAAEYNLNLQYRMDAATLKFFGVPKISCKFKKYANCAHVFYMIVINRLLVLGANPSVSAGTVTEQEDLPALFQKALADENSLCALGIAGIQTAVKNGDEATAEKLRHIEERHEKHVAWIEQQLMLIKSIGLDEYTAEKL